MDTGICPEGLRCESFASYKICKDESDPGEMSHGTLCARVLDSLADAYELVSIQILPNQSRGESKSLGLIEHFREGLKLCLELKADLVCMSAVSSVLSDSVYLYDITERLAGQSVLLAALDNRRFLTIPTAYPFVLGVQSDYGNVLSPGELAYCREDPYFANVYANCGIGLLRQLRCAPSNSFAVPVAAAKVNEWINRKQDVREAIESLRAYPGQREGKIPVPEWKQDSGREVPLVWMRGRDMGWVYEVCRSVMDELYRRHQIQTSGLVSGMFGYDVRLRRLTAGEDLRRALLFMERHYKTDLIFLLAEQGQSEEGGADADVTVLVSGGRAEVAYEGQRVECSAETLAEEIYLAFGP